MNAYCRRVARKAFERNVVVRDFQCRPRGELRRVGRTHEGTDAGGEDGTVKPAVAHKVVHALVVVACGTRYI